MNGIFCTRITREYSVNLNRCGPVLIAWLMCQLKSLSSSACRCRFMRYYVNVRMCVCAHLWIIYSQPTSSYAETVHFIIGIVSECMQAHLCNKTEWVFCSPLLLRHISATGRPCDTTYLHWQEWERSPFPPVIHTKPGAPEKLCAHWKYESSLLVFVQKKFKK